MSLRDITRTLPHAEVRGGALTRATQRLSELQKLLFESEKRARPTSMLKIRAMESAKVRMGRLSG